MQLPISFLRECFEIVGNDLVWKKRPCHHFSSEKICSRWNINHAGNVAGYKSRQGNLEYMKIRMESRFANACLKAHRIAFALHYGRHPKYFVDHIDGNGTNNSKENLRDITNAESNKNMRRRFTSSSIISGVVFRKERGKWYAMIHSNNIKTHLGVFDNLFDACCARISEQNKRGFSSRHGRD